MEAIKTKLCFKTIEFHFSQDKDISMRYWIGAVLRNRFLYESEYVLDKDGISLRKKIDTLQLPEDHFLYKQLKNGFPKGFLIDCSDIPTYGSGFKLRANYIYKFKLVLIGSFIEYKNLVITAVKNMLTNGFGHPVTSMELINIVESRSYEMPELTLEKSMPIFIELNFKTPVCLMHVPKENSNGFQNKLNNFPSFYQFMRSLVYRVITLSILYSKYQYFENRQQMDEWIEQYISSTIKSILIEAQIRFETVHCTPKTGKSNVYVMNGYIGKLSFDNVEYNYLPLLEFCSNIGVGSDINFGLGSFDIYHRIN